MPHTGALPPVWRPAVGSAVLGLAAVVVVAARLTPPAVTIADRSLAYAAILVIATVLTLAIMSPRPRTRESRLAATLLVMGAAVAWYSGRLWIHEKQFDYLVDAQQTSLRLSALELSGNIERFLDERRRGSPPAPVPATWQHDVDAVLQFDEETSILYERRFGPQVRRTCELLALEGLRDPDLTMFYRRPATGFQIDVVARKLAGLAHRLERRPA
jgi:hypothetical protein